MNNNMNVTITVTINNNDDRLRRERAEEQFCRSIISRINNICNTYKKAVVDIDMLTTVGSADRALMIESLLEAYTYELESLKAECRKHNVKKENMDLIFVGLGF